MTPQSLTLGYMPGGPPAKWARIWAQRHPDVPLHLHPVAAADAADAVRGGVVDLSLLRLPADTTGLAVIPLYEETTVVVVPKDHVVTAADEVTAADLDDEPTLIPLDDVVGWPDAPGVAVEYRPETTGAAIELVATGMGVLIVPQSLARLHHRRDLTHRPIVDAPTCAVGLAFPEGQPSVLVEEFIGIVRGRRPGSSRGTPPPPKRTAREKTLAKQAARAAAGKIPRRPAKPKRGRR
ncbi:lysR substrate binding domain protein [Mycolicibacterium hassiacum DSM 44199]|uniref:LysR substrate binding domain protein n=1 Tax=Mycolicibacterium hassiacum (strain DSM 44199 / CIP 105218 / JCM 12690 / 3849) TaxID=1122247 RepID=K5BKP7_MYCHD|nr:LysR family transcriptional regulator substrate-binding protein [Mycolicibacterium hassiacum]EKF25234.1 lysR substrate binding domain protein [Mycolicibacterium hassiacum DSM 44199]MDA4087205.1 LysR family transcriptional regulator [Mycolicibacterium hassiacum DSM 44199]VCT89186.1 Hca operon transcriptional activator HcaR [Mycolicibacterium hassiacum DSM 44199]